MLSATADLLDVNVWLALALQGHPHHEAALGRWPALVRPVFCRITQLGFLRLLCNSQVMGADILRPEAAWAVYDQLLAGGSARFMEEPPGLDACLNLLLEGGRPTRDFWTDAYLAAFARSAGLRLVTFDSGFRRFSGLSCEVLAGAKS